MPRARSTSPSSTTSSRCASWRAKNAKMAGCATVPAVPWAARPTPRRSARRGTDCSPDAQVAVATHRQSARVVHLRRCSLPLATPRGQCDSDQQRTAASAPLLRLRQSRLPDIPQQSVATPASTIGRVHDRRAERASRRCARVSTSISTTRSSVPSPGCKDTALRL